MGTNESKANKPAEAIVSDKKEHNVIDAVIHTAEKDLRKHPKKLNELFHDADFEGLSKKEKRAVVNSAIENSLTGLASGTYKTEEDLREAIKNKLKDIKVEFKDKDGNDKEVHGDLTKTNGRKNIPYHQTNEVGFLRYAEEHKFVQHAAAIVATAVMSPVAGLAVEAAATVSNRGGHNRATSDKDGVISQGSDFVGDKAIQGVEAVGDLIGKIGNKNKTPKANEEVAKVEAPKEASDKKEPVAEDKKTPVVEGDKKKGVKLGDELEKAAKGVGKFAKKVGNGIGNGVEDAVDAVGDIFKKGKKHDATPAVATTVEKPVVTESNSLPGSITPAVKAEVPKEIVVDNKAIVENQIQKNKSQVFSVKGDVGTQPSVLENPAKVDAPKPEKATVAKVSEPVKVEPVIEKIKEEKASKPFSETRVGKLLGKVDDFFSKPLEKTEFKPITVEANKDGKFTWTKDESKPKLSKAELEATVSIEPVKSRSIEIPKIEIPKNTLGNIDIKHAGVYKIPESSNRSVVAAEPEKLVEPKPKVNQPEIKAAAVKEPEAPYTIKAVGDYIHIAPKAGHSADEVRDYIVKQAQKSGMSEDKISSAMGVYEKCVVPGKEGVHSFSKAAVEDLKKSGKDFDDKNPAKAYGDYADLTKELLSNSKTKIDCGDTKLNATDVAARGYGNVKKECETTVSK